MDEERQGRERNRWLAERKSGIGGSDAAAILGVSPYRTATEVWLDKTGQVPEKPPTEAMWWGTALEDIVARRYSEAKALKLFNPERLYRHPQHDMLLGTPDRLVVSEPMGLEVKTASHFAASQWGPPDTDAIPYHYLLQCVHYMAITGYDRWDVAVLIGGSDFRTYTIRRDRELEAEVVGLLVAWWQRHMVQGITPPLGGGEGVRQWLASRYPREAGVEPVPAPAEAEQWAEALAKARAMQTLCESQRVECENNIKALMGEVGAFSGNGWGCTWKATKPTQKVDWEAMAALLLAATKATPEQVADLEKRFTVTGPPTRRFVFNSIIGRELA